MDTLSEQAFLVLAALADRPRHGYALVTEVATMSDGRVQLRASTLYAVLERLTGRGLIAHDHDEVDSGRLRRFYRLTDAGAEAVHAEAERMTAQVRAARRRLARRDARSTPKFGVTG
jgi:DNA-binding PadR family transcriptional regulator